MKSHVVEKTKKKQRHYYLKCGGLVVGLEFGVSKDQSIIRNKPRESPKTS
jgi:hypothetical protein